MALVPAMHNLMIAVTIPMPTAIPMSFVAVLFVTVALSIIIMIFVFVAMFVVTTPVSMIFILGKNHAGA
jgi:hypothetical protein